MPARDPSTWSPAYAKRIARAAAKGLSKQQARGHKAGEHVTRATNKGLPAPKPRQPSKEPRYDGQLTKSEKAYVRRVINELNRRSPMDPAEARKLGMEYATRVGMVWFRMQVQRQRDAQARGRGETGFAALDGWQADDGFPLIAWYFYH
jgi:hypothetical protein